MNAYSMFLAIAMLFATASQGFAQVALSGWMPGVATNYGGPASGMNPNTPSFGLSNVSCPNLHLLSQTLCARSCTTFPRMASVT